LRLSDGLHVDLGKVEEPGVVEMFIERVTELNNLRLDHFAQQVVSFTRALADAREHRKARTRFRDVIDQLHHDNGLAYSGTAEQTDLSTAQKRLDQVDDLDTRFKHLQLSRLFFERWRVTMDRIAFLVLHRAKCIHRFANNVEHATE